MDYRIVLICVSFLVKISNGKFDNLRICVVGNPKLKTSHTTKYCDYLDSSKKSQVTCVYAVDRLECLRFVSKKKADFTALEAEELFFSTLWDESAVLVVAEIRALQKYSFEDGTVVVVKNSLNITGLDDLRGKNVCHLGYSRRDDRNALFTQYFEERIEAANCEDGLTSYEDRIKTTSQFFGNACKAGLWSPDADEDARLKGTYKNLCALCDEPEKCDTSDKYYGSGGSITCLKDGVGDVLWASYSDVKHHFKLTIGISSQTTSGYSLLCDDGTLKPVTTSDPCFWLARPWRVMVAHRKAATDVQKVLDFLRDDERNDWESDLLYAFESYMEYLQILVVSKTPEDYLKSIPGYLSASAMSEENCTPERSVSICTTSPFEQSKCFWMSRAAASYNIHPAIRCIQKPNLQQCMDRVAAVEIDVVLVRPDFEFEAIRRYHLSSLMYESTKNPHESYLLFAVVRSSEIKTLQDLQSKKACFTTENGFGWNSALYVLQNQSYIGSARSGKEDEALKSFFKDVCVTQRKSNETALKLCCPEEEKNEDDVETDTFQCMAKGECDVAFVSQSTLLTNTGSKPGEAWSNAQILRDFRTVCRSQKQTECHWAWSYNGNFMISNNMTTQKRQETTSLLLKLSLYFGKKLKKTTSSLELFAPFNNKKNVMFQDTSFEFTKYKHWNLENNQSTIFKGVAINSSSGLKFHGVILLAIMSILAT